MYQERAYQTEAHNATKRFVEHESGHGIMCASGGAGKSIMIARDAEYLFEQGKRVVVLADRAKLLEQNFAKFSDKNNVGIVSAGLGETDYSKPILVAGIQTVWDKAHLIGNADWLLIDECNAVGNDLEGGVTRYHQFIRSFLQARILGYTATPFTLQEGQLNWGKVYHKILYSRLLKEGWLTPLTNKIKGSPDTSKIPHAGKEYNLTALAEYMSVPELVKQTAKSIAEAVKTDNRKKGLVFCVDKKHAEEVCVALIHEGIKADLLLGTMPEKQRAQKYEDFAGDWIDCLVNVEIATTGLDFPFTDWIACLRPTESLSLWHQILYRGVRLSPDTGKVDCLLLDYSGNLEKHGGLMNQLWEYMGSTKKKVGKALKICPACEEGITIGHESCPACGYVFEKEEILKELKHDKIADLKSDLNADNSIERIWEVGKVFYRHHTTVTGAEYLRVEYQLKNSQKSVSEYIPFGGTLGWQKGKCLDFIKPRAKELPETIPEALELCDNWKKPSLIKVRPQKSNPKYYQLMEVIEWA